MNQRSIILILMLLLLLQDSGAYFYPPFIWQKDNCAFRQLQEKNSNGTKEYYMQVIPNSGMNVVCPNYVTVNTWLKDGGLSVSNPTLNENMWLVDKQGYDNCRVNEKGDPKFNRLFMLCNKPQTIKYESFYFNPNFNDKEPKFAVGQHYYFISTSRGYRSELSTRKVSGSYGSCQRYHMKLHVYVCDPKKEDCIWEIPHCDPPAEIKRDMRLIDGKLPAPTRQVALRKPKTQVPKTQVPKTTEKTPTTEEPSRSVTRENVITEESIVDTHEQDEIKPCRKTEKGTSIHLILNFVLGGVALFMAIVIIILACGLANKSKETKDYQLDGTRPRSSSAYEPNKYVCVETLAYNDLNSSLGHRPSLATLHSNTLPQHMRINYSRAPPSNYTPPTYDGRVFIFPDMPGDRTDTRVEAPLTRSGDEADRNSV